MRPPRLRCTLFPLIYPPHLLGSYKRQLYGFVLFSRLTKRNLASYVISVRRTKSLLTASFRFHLTMDTLAVLLYTSSLPRRVRDFHPLERTHGAQTKKRPLFSQRAIDSRYHLYYIEETPLYISSYSLTGTTPGPPTVTSAFLLQSYLLHLYSQVPRSQWASLSVRTTYAYSSFSTHLTGLSTMKLQNIIATEVLFVKVFREFSENLKRRGLLKYNI